MSERICAVSGCGKPHDSRGYCPTHARRDRLYGSPIAQAAPRPPSPKRLGLKCTVDGCDLVQYGRGWCANHYARWRRHGGLHDARAARVDPRIRFDAKLNRDGPTPTHRTDLGPCWLWTDRPNGAGYGSFRIDGRTIGAHVAAVILDGRNVPEGMEVDHLCRTRMCARASHLEVVTHDENIRRNLPFRAVPEVCIYGHPLTADNIMASQGARACRTCFKDSQRRYRQKRKALAT